MPTPSPRIGGSKRERKVGSKGNERGIRKGTKGEFEKGTKGDGEAKDGRTMDRHVQVQGFKPGSCAALTTKRNNEEERTMRAKHGHEERREEETKNEPKDGHENSPRELIPVPCRKPQIRAERCNASAVGNLTNALEQQGRNQFPAAP
eukprot:scaffold772_cov339-Pavlova_lutheri.AAC.74